MKIEFVTHCWNYWRCLSLQLSSFILYPTEEVEVIVSVCYSPEDTATTDRLNQIVGWLQDNGCPKNLELRLHPMENSLLFRRAIGRNMLALKTEADWVWFADCDMMFDGGAIDNLGRYLTNLEEESPDIKMVFPRYVRASTQENGDELIYSVGDVWDEPLRASLTGFHKKRYNAAIGGAQVVRKDVCVSKGYLNDYPQYRRPETRWKRTREDPLFRRKCIGSRGHPVVESNICDGVSRVRHTKRGRFDIGLEM
jgi:hypothetical protein